jgi:hypothetical protein
MRQLRGNSRSMIRALLLALVFAGSAGMASAQATVTLNGFGGPMVQYAGLDGDSRLHVGGGGALLVNGKFFAGLYGMAMVSPIERKVLDPRLSPPDSVTLRIGFTQGGLWTGYIVNPENKLQVSVNTLAGIGALRSSELDRRDRVYLVSPHIGVRYAVTDFMRLELVGGYRAVFKDNNLELLRNEDQGAPFGGLHLTFGGFE